MLEKVHKRRRVLILAATNVAADARVTNQIESLRAVYSVTCASVGPPGNTVDEYIPLRIVRRRAHAPIRNRIDKAFRITLLALRNYELNYWRQRWVRDATVTLTHLGQFDVIIANTLEMLPLALRVAGPARVVYDAHEFYPEYPYFSSEFEQELWSKYSSYLSSKYMPKASCTLTVSPEIQDLYKRKFQIESFVVENCPPAVDIPPGNVNGSSIHLVHHGACQRSRGLQTLIEMMRFTDSRFKLHFMLTGDPKSGFYRSLKLMAASDSRVHFHDAVPVKEIVAAINRFDIGICLLPSNNLHYQSTLPNKFFDFIQARLAVATGPSRAMGRLVNEHRIGVVAKKYGPQEMADELNALDAAKIKEFKMNAGMVAPCYTAERAGARLRDILEYII